MLIAILQHHPHNDAMNSKSEFPARPRATNERQCRVHEKPGAVLPSVQFRAINCFIIFLLPPKICHQKSLTGAVTRLQCGEFFFLLNVDFETFDETNQQMRCCRAGRSNRKTSGPRWLCGVNWRCRSVFIVVSGYTTTRSQSVPDDRRQFCDLGSKISTPSNFVVGQKRTWVAWMVKIRRSCTPGIARAFNTAAHDKPH